MVSAMAKYGVSMMEEYWGKEETERFMRWHAEKINNNNTLLRSIVSDKARVKYVKGPNDTKSKSKASANAKSHSPITSSSKAGKGGLTNAQIMAIQKENEAIMRPNDTKSKSKAKTKSYTPIASSSKAGKEGLTNTRQKKMPARTAGLVGSPRVTKKRSKRTMGKRKEVVSDSDDELSISDDVLAESVCGSSLLDDEDEEVEDGDENDEEVDDGDENEEEVDEESDSDVAVKSEEGSSLMGSSLMDDEKEEDM
ncbi:hypothetical protein HYALB_00005029 [Hymenoscyphus albidus]|uniref:Uncharacterized protein n=1 Tax=Hymenoscyphus albidus TaxID=595503 RepID=A0A9N9Q3P8_9HELO|nr:hypothetical protein HYALB_00005029 [Hymenoscyphus albidus]